MTRIATLLKYLAARIYNVALWFQARGGKVAPGPTWWASNRG